MSAQHPGRIRQLHQIEGIMHAGQHQKVSRKIHELPYNCQIIIMQSMLGFCAEPRHAFLRTAGEVVLDDVRVIVPETRLGVGAAHAIRGNGCASRVRRSGHVLCAVQSGAVAAGSG